jgi:hypothetical protein
LSSLNFDQNVRLAALNDEESYVEVGVEKKAKLTINAKRMMNSGRSSLYLGINDVENIMAQPMELIGPIKFSLQKIIRKTR